MTRVQASVKGKASALMLAGILSKLGIKDVFVSPDSRNSPIILAFRNIGEMNIRTVVDERSAAFIGLGACSVSRRPVVLVCTSGSALLNYAPALAEAYYRRIPLIAVSADRPADRIDRLDSQTIHQEGALRNVVKYDVDIDDFSVSDITAAADADRKINDAVINALRMPCGPVHINLRFNEPLEEDIAPDKLDCRLIRHFSTLGAGLTPAQWSQLDEDIAGKKILVVAGQASPDHKLSQAISKLAAIPSVAVVADRIANLNAEEIVSGQDLIIPLIKDDPAFIPDILISFGGAQISRKIKEWLRDASVKRHWHIGFTPENIPDTYNALTDIIEVEPHLFFRKLAVRISHLSIRSEYSSIWKTMSERCASFLKEYASSAEWSDLAAFQTIFSNLPEKINLSLSNGMAIRYSELFQSRNIHMRSCNRGVSGIDGSLSTALGESIAYAGQTLAITGDMSLRYDMGALASDLWHDRFSVAVINNSGGDIFRMIGCTSDKATMQQNLAAPDAARLPLKALANAFGFRYLEVHDRSELVAAMNELKEATGKKLINIITDPDKNFHIYKELFRKIKNK